MRSRTCWPSGTRPRRWWPSGRPRTRSSPSDGCGSPCCGPSGTSGWTSRTARSADYEAVIDQVDLASIAARERVTRHDVKARIEEFNALAGHEQVHKGMTSRDLTENIEQTQILRIAAADPGPQRRRAGPAGPPGRRVLRPGDGRPLAQRAGPGHHPGQAVRLGGRGGSAGLSTAFGSAGAVPDARHQGPGRHLAGHARPARLRRRPWRRWNPSVVQEVSATDTAAGQRRPGVSPVAGLRGGLRAGATGRRARRRWPPRSG